MIGYPENQDPMLKNVIIWTLHNNSIYMIKVKINKTDWHVSPYSCTPNAISVTLNILHTGLVLNEIILTSSRHRASSCAFSLTNSSRGYCSLGKGAIGQSKEGTSSFWIAFVCVVDRQPVDTFMQCYHVLYMCVCSIHMHTCMMVRPLLRQRKWSNSYLETNHLFIYLFVYF